MENMFEIASQKKLRFESPRGQIDTESLWDIPLTSTSNFSLDVIAKAIARQIRTEEEESFVTIRTAGSDILQLKLDIVKHIIAVKLAEKEAQKNASAVKAKKEILLGALAEKETEGLKAMSKEQLLAELAKM